MGHFITVCWCFFQSICSPMIYYCHDHKLVHPVTAEVYVSNKQQGFPMCAPGKVLPLQLQHQLQCYCQNIWKPEIVHVHKSQTNVFSFSVEYKGLSLKKENNLAQGCSSERVLHRHRVLSLNGVINLSPQRESPVKLGNGTVCASLMSLMSCSIQLSAVTHRRCKPAVMQNFAPQSPVYKLSYRIYFETSE